MSMRRLNLYAFMRHLLRMRIVRVACIGGIGLLIQTSVFEIIGIWLELVRPSSAVLIGAVIGVLANFFLNNHFSFRDRLPDAAPLIIRLLRFHLVIMGSLFIQWLFVFFAERATEDLFLIHVAYFAGVGVGFISNYSGYYFWVWRNHMRDAPSRIGPSVAAGQTPDTASNSSSD